MTLKKRLIFFVFVPSVIAMFYYGLVASDMYVSEARFSVRGADGGNTSEWLMLLGQSGGSVSADSYIVKEYVHSMDMLLKLEDELSLREHYSGQNGDIVTSLSTSASSEDFLEYYQKVVSIAYDSGSGILLLSARAYTPQMSQKICQAILDFSEQLVNGLSARALQDALNLARDELRDAEKRVARAQVALAGLRQQTDVLNPEATAGALLNLVSQLEADAAKTRAELAEARSYMREESSKIIALKARIEALEGQIVFEKERLTGSGDNVLNNVVADFERIAVEREFAEKQYVSALTSLESARIRAESKSRYLVAFVEPPLPQESTWPKRSEFILLFIVANILGFSIGSLIVAAVREHAGV